MTSLITLALLFSIQKNIFIHIHIRTNQMQFPPYDHCGCERLWYVPAFPHLMTYIEVIHGHIIYPYIIISLIRLLSTRRPNPDHIVIHFYSGKTTIIESLKYAVTGSLPPGIKSGQSFVHDPRSIGQSSVKASIKLRFTNTEGSSMVVARSMEVSQKKTTASFKALDGTIRTVNRETGERVTLSHKCTELDNSIPTYLGVSKRELMIFVCLVIVYIFFLTLTRT